jgi:uncharacterized DUF497 family protein
VTAGAFEWDKVKEQINLAKHGVDFTEAQQAFLDPLRLIAADSPHTQAEPRLFCIGQTERGILTVRFTFRASGVIRLIGAGYWRNGKKLYEKENC